MPDAFEHGTRKVYVNDRVRELAPYGLQPPRDLDAVRLLGDTIGALESGIPEQTSVIAGKLSFKVFRPQISTRRVSAAWLERKPTLPSDLPSILKPEGNSKTPKTGFSVPLGESFWSEIFNMTTAMSQAD